MKTFAVSLIIFLASCTKPGNEHVPRFSPNGSRSEVFEDLRPVVERYDFVFTFFTRASASYGWYSVLGLKADKWDRIEIRTADIERDSIGHIWMHSTTRTRTMDSTEIAAFLDILRNGHVLDLPEETTPLAKCLDVIGATTFPDVMDAPTYFVQLVAGNNVRTVKYYDPEGRRSKCPSVPEWGYMLAIEKAMAAPG